MTEAVVVEDQNPCLVRSCRHGYMDHFINEAWQVVCRICGSDCGDVL